MKGWRNQPGYTTTPPSQGVTITLGVNDSIDFEDDGGVNVATIEPGVYTTGASLAAAVQAALGIIVDGTGLCSYNGGTKKLLIRDLGETVFQLLWLSGANNAKTAALSLGFDKIDDTGNSGNTGYTSDNALPL